MAILEGLKYTKSHEWVKENGDGTVTVGQWVPEVVIPICLSPTYTGQCSRAIPRPVTFNPTRQRFGSPATTKAAFPMVLSKKQM